MKKRVDCPSCGAGLRVDSANLGKAANCPKCGLACTIEENEVGVFLGNPAFSPPERVRGVGYWVGWVLFVYGLLTPFAIMGGTPPGVILVGLIAIVIGLYMVGKRRVKRLRLVQE